MSLRPPRRAPGAGHDDAFDDIEISDPRAMRALAHPVRLAALSRLQSHGPATASGLAPLVGATPSVTSWHLRHLARFGLVEEWDGGTDGRLRWWKAAARGIRVVRPPEGAERAEGAEAAYRALGSQLIAQALDRITGWQREDEPRLEPRWRAAADLSSTTVLATAEEIEELRAGIEDLLAPYVRRRDARAARDGERYVRMIRLALPAAPGDEPAAPAASDRPADAAVPAASAAPEPPDPSATTERPTP